LKNELEFLKSQIQPHFFFNTLNNLYSLTLKKSDLAPEVVVKLSDLMSYMLYESDSLETTLRKEVEHIKNYLDLEGLRFGKRLHLNFDIIGEVDKKKIPPLLLLPFIENAFKHGTSHETGEIHLKIELNILHDKLVFGVTNPRFENQSSRKKHKG
jgi:LytS/YehU family sensor histidine kinase